MTLIARPTIWSRTSDRETKEKGQPTVSLSPSKISHPSLGETHMNALEALKPHVDKLHALLAEPEPGLFTWSMFVAKEWRAIAELWEPSLQSANAENSQTFTDTPEERQKQNEEGKE